MARSVVVVVSPLDRRGIRAGVGGFPALETPEGIAMTRWLVRIVIAILLGILAFAAAWMARGYNHPI